MLPERSTTASIATPSVEISSRTVPFLGRARATISSPTQTSLATVSDGLSLMRHDREQLFISTRLGNRTAAVRFLRSIRYAIAGRTKSSISAQGEYNRIYALPISAVSSETTISVISIFRSSDLVFSMKFLTRSNVS